MRGIAGGLASGSEGCYTFRPDSFGKDESEYQSRTMIYEER
jgi:hypothetical protein